MPKLSAFVATTLLFAATALAVAPEALAKGGHGGGGGRGGGHGGGHGHAFHGGGKIHMGGGHHGGRLRIGGHRGGGKVHFGRVRHGGIHALRAGRPHAATRASRAAMRSSAPSAFRNASLVSRATTGWSHPGLRRGVATALTGSLAVRFHARPAFRAAIWPGPLFFPYALDDVFWPTAYDDVFWTYGTPDIVAGILEPQLYAPDAWAAPRHRYRPRSGLQQGRAVAPPPATAQPCGERGELSGLAGIEAELGPTAEQRALFEDLKAAETSAAEILVSACPTHVPPTPIGRLDAMAQGFNAMLQAVRTVRPPLERFYGALTDEQKARLFNAGAERRDAASRWLARCRSEPRAFASLSMDGIARELRLDRPQLTALDDLAHASDEAANAVRGSCPAEIPLTPTGRLVAIDKRLSALLRALDTMRPALDRFYASLSDEQRERFDRIGERPRRRAG